MEFERLSIPDLILFKPKIFSDERGFFFESFRQEIFKEATSINIPFPQDNHSHSKKGVLRGLHYQLPPHGQGKLVRVTQGEVYDVAVDIRKSSPTFGKWVGAILSDQNHHELWIPRGFAHGFITLSDTADFLYKTTQVYNPASERAIRFDDPTLNIDWHFKDEPILAPKDLEAPSFLKAEYFA
jgi:dTDP-4-dehydrorhamnose 3,5-epimerase